MDLYLQQLHQRLSDCLFEQVMPFWLRHAVDEAGGLNTCLTDDGQLISRDKWLWSQWRAVWVFTRLFRRTKDLKWLEMARHIFDFACAHGWNGESWRLCVSSDGAELRGAESIYVDAFAMYGLAEFVRATGDHVAKKWLSKTTTNVAKMLSHPHDTIPHFPYPIPAGMRVHGIPMIFSFCFFEAADHCDSPDCIQIAQQLSDQVFTSFYKPSRDVVLERINDDGSEAPTPLGTAVVPGHVIESMWFQIHIARHSGNTQRIRDAARLIRRHLELGWDSQFGGIMLAIDADESPEVGWAFSDYKLWWPHTEAMYALLCAYESTREQWCIDWFKRVEEYSFSRFPHPNAGEWIQRLRRDGRPTQDVVALPVKDPFHLPRSLILSLECLERMATHAPKTPERPIV